MNKLNKLNKKLITLLILLVVIISTLFVSKVIAYTDEMKSESDYNKIGTDVGDSAVTTYEDLLNYYSILCCEHGRELVSASKTKLKVTYGGTDYEYDAGNLTANDIGKVLFKHRIYSYATDFSKSSYKSYTWGRYEVVENKIATPKEAYILAEMSAELDAGETIYYKILLDEDGERERYYGGVIEANSYYLSERETLYFINHTYVLETDEGNYYVGQGYDSEGNMYYVYDTGYDGSVKEYNGNFEFGDAKTGGTVKLEGTHVDEVYYEFEGTISEPGTEVPGSGTLYLLSYETVIKLDGVLYRCELENSYSYIQIAWWSTEAGSRYSAIPVPSNTLAMEAEAFEAYILNITGKTSVDDLEMIQTEQKYVLTDDEGNEIDSGYITAPKIDYEPKWNIDANQNGEIDGDITDKVTVSFEQETNQYVIGPFSIDYIKEGAEIESRQPVDFACITGVELKTNKGELELGKDWEFEWLYGERDPEDTSIYPNPNEVFNIRVDYIEGLTQIENFHFDFKYMNAGGLYSDLQGYYYLCKWGVHVGEAVYAWIDESGDIVSEDDLVDEDGDGEYDNADYKFRYQYTWVSFDSMEERREQQLAHAIIGVRWYKYLSLDWNGDIPERYAYIDVEKNVIDSDGEIVNVNDTFAFEIWLDRGDGEYKYFETMSFEVVDGHGEDRSSKIVWLEGEPAPKYKVIETIYNKDKYDNDGPWEGTLPDGDTAHTANVRAVNSKIDDEDEHGYLGIDKILLDTALESETFTFNIFITEGKFEYNGNKYNIEANSEESKTVFKTVTVNSSTNWAWTSDEFTWKNSSDKPKYRIEEVIPEGAEYELVGEIVNGQGSLIDGEVVRAVATNDTTRNGGYIQLIKEGIQSDKEFTFNVLLTGKFEYDGTPVDGIKEFDVKVKANETWTSGYITWRDGEEPVYTIKEINIPDGYEFVSISNSLNQPSTDLEAGISGKISHGNNIITAINDELEDKEGYLEIVKKSQTSVDNETTGEDNVTGKTFTFNVTLKGDFNYQGVDYTSENPYTFEVTAVADGEGWTSDVITWREDKEAPTYIVEETNMDVLEDVEFVSISNGKDTVVNIPRIDGTITENETTIVTAINRGKITIPNGGYLELSKKVLNESLKGEIFKFDVLVKGQFKYVDENDQEIVVNDEKLFTPSVEADGESWVSPNFTWEKDVAAPTYEIIETNLNEFENVEFVSFSNGTETVETNRITGSLENGEVVLITVTNTTSEIPQEGFLEIVKKAEVPTVSGKEFTFDVVVKGNFEYEGTKYTPESPLTFTTPAIKADGESWKSSKFTWESNSIPEYEIKENLVEGIDLVSLSNGKQTTQTNSISGELKVNETVVITAINTENTKEPVHGDLYIKKVFLDADGKEIENKEFKVLVTVEGYLTDEPMIITSGKTIKVGTFSWYPDEEAPTYEVKEVDGEKYNAIYENEKGQLTCEGTASVTVTITNTLDEPKHSGKIQIRKDCEIDEEKESVIVTQAFEFAVTISSEDKFKCNGKLYDNESYTFTVTIQPDTIETLPEVYWWDTAPTYVVQEINIPYGWYLIDMSQNSAGTFSENDIPLIVATNSKSYDKDIRLTMEMGGKVWDDTNRTNDKHVDAQENGKIDENEPGIEKVLVNVYRVVADKNGKVLERLGNALIYDEEDNITLKADELIYTDKLGNWTIGSVAVPTYLNKDEKNDLKSKYGEEIQISYDVEFTYDGQTYEPTKYLATSDGDVGKFKTASAVERDAWLYDSVVKDSSEERNAFNSSFETIEGKESIDINGNTEGLATGSNGEIKDLHYRSVDQTSLTNADITRKVSSLETRNKDGYIYDELKLSARTSTGTLLYPLMNKYGKLDWNISYWDKEITDVEKITKHYSATYNYTLSINLGLNEREYSDTSLEKDLNSAMVVVNGKALKYKYNTAIDLESPDNRELLYKQLEVDDQVVEYKLGLYSSDYYYRASTYDGTEAGMALDGYYTNTLNLPAESTELEIYLTYLISVHNESNTYDLRVNSIADYYDSNLELIKENVSRNIQELNGEEVNALTVVAEPSKAIYYSADNQEVATIDVNWNDTLDTITGSDGVTYTRMTTDSLRNQNIVHGGRVDVYVTLRVEKDVVNDEGVENAIKLGEKYNLAEVESFTTYYSDASENRWSNPGEVTGRVDGDSAPNNINIKDLNDSKYYEDDTDSAPAIEIFLNENTRNVTGLAFDDAQTEQIEYNQYVGDGVYTPDKGDTPIKDMKVEIIEIIRIPQSDGTYKEYEFEWPTDEPIPALGNKTISELTGFNQEVVTNGNGEYIFTSVPAGNYIVRFIYGEDDNVIITGNSGSQEVLNGQDYKTTTYQSGFESITDTNGNGYVDNEWHDLTNTDLSNKRVSDVRDNEARRLLITSKSQMLTYENSSVLATADDKDADHTALLGDFDSAESTSAGPVYGDGYYMYADTAKINLSLENLYEISTGAPNSSLSSTNVGGLEVGEIAGAVVANGVEVGTTNFNYTIKNIDCGLEERSKTSIILDKQIKEIILKTSDGNVILDAVYDIYYEVKDNKVISTVKLNESASIGYNKVANLNKSNSSQGYRYIMAEGQILQGTVLEVKYQLSIFNVSETDRTSALLKPLWESINTSSSEEEQANIINKEVAKLATTTYNDNGKVYNGEPIEYGMYFGSIYYQGKDGNTTDEVVETKVHQLIDYVDNDAVFSDDMNIGKNNAWSNTTIEYLLENKLIDPSVIQIIDASGNVTGDTRADREIAEGERYSILDEEYQEYVTDLRNNLILNNDNSEDADGGNPNLIRYLAPYAKTNNLEESSASVTLYVSRYFASETDASDIDNAAEIIKVQNTVGRRTVKTVAGNLNPFALNEVGEPIGEYLAAAEEVDSSATEIVTLSPPTGIDSTENRTVQIVFVVLISTVILATGIVLIKKKVLDKE